MRNVTNSVQSYLPAAPGSVEHPSIALANTRYTAPNHQIIDRLKDPATATAWAHEENIIHGSYALREYCTHKLTDFRAVVYDLFEAFFRGKPPASRSLAAVNKKAQQAIMHETLAWDQKNKQYTICAVHPTTREVDDAIARIAHDAIELLSGEDRNKLTRCQAPDCDRIFFRTHARRRWCSVRCGDRVRAARAYERKHQKAAVKSPKSS